MLLFRCIFVPIVGCRSAQNSDHLTRSSEHLIAPVLSVQVVKCPALSLRNAFPFNELFQLRLVSENQKFQISTRALSTPMTPYHVSLPCSRSKTVAYHARAGDSAHKRTPSPPRHATPRHATPRHATPRHATTWSER